MPTIKTDGELKYDVLRHFLRTELAKKNNGYKSFSKADICAALESVRGKTGAELKALATAAAAKRVAVRAMTGDNGDSPVA